MKNLFLFLLIAACCLPACKKGENDPFLSLRSRKARITGKWILTEKQSNYQAFGSDTFFYPWSESESFNGSFMTKTYSSPNFSFTNSYAYSYEMTISKDGTYSVVKVDENGSSEITETWTWLDGNKNKNQILLYDWYVIDRLTNKELILKYDFYSKGTDEINDFWSESTYSETRTFKKD